MVAIFGDGHGFREAPDILRPLIEAVETGRPTHSLLRTINMQIHDVFNAVIEFLLPAAIRKADLEVLEWMHLQCCVCGREDRLHMEIVLTLRDETSETVFDWLAAKKPNVLKWEGIILLFIIALSKKICLWLNTLMPLQDRFLPMTDGLWKHRFTFMHVENNDPVIVRRLRMLGPNPALDAAMLRAAVRKNCFPEFRKNCVLTVRLFGEDAPAMRELCLANGGEIVRCARGRRMMRELARAAALTRSDLASVGLPRAAMRLYESRRV